MSQSAGQGSPADRVRLAWERSGKDNPPDLAALLAAAGDISPSTRTDAIVADAEERWTRGFVATVEHYKRALPADAEDPQTIRALLMLEATRRRQEDAERVQHDLKA
ncbi:MAG TPA: hypothetical protein VK176_04925, partial [Phycisphaerales bacterium]|nr:hypothetical protein [Phycisphaerales bacterium]